MLSICLCYNHLHKVVLKKDTWHSDPYCKEKIYFEVLPNHAFEMFVCKAQMFSIRAEKDHTNTKGLWTECVSVSHFILSLVLFPLLLLLPPFSSSSHAVCLSPSSHPGPQNKDSRESLPYDGEEKEVKPFACCQCVTQRRHVVKQNLCLHIWSVCIEKDTAMTRVCLHVQSGGLCLRFYLPACITRASETCRHRCTPCGYRFSSKLIKHPFNTGGWLITGTVLWCFWGFWDCRTQQVRLKIQERMAPVGNGQTVIKEGKSNDFIWGCVADSGGWEDCHVRAG